MIQPRHTLIERALRMLDCDVDAAECHGLLCGMLCAPQRFDANAWHRYLSGREAYGEFEASEPTSVLADLVAETAAELDSGDYTFVLLLPDDDAPLAARAAGFASWCRGFLSGLGLAGIADLSVVGEDAQEFLRDLERFGSLVLGQDTAEDDERALAELCEFTRIGVLIVYADTRESGRDDAKARLH